MPDMWPALCATQNKT